MKIIEINFFLGGGGASRLMVDLCNQFAKNQNNQVIAVAVVEQKSSGNDYISFINDLDSKVHYIALNAKSGLCFKSLLGIFRLIKKEEPDVVHLHSNILLLLLPALFCHKTRYVHTIHTLVTRQYPGGLIKQIAHWLYRKGLIQPVTISNECHESYLECFGSKDDILITNGRAALQTTDRVPDVGKELTLLGIGDGSPVFIHVARHHPVKNHDRLFSTFNRLSDEGVNYHLLVIGDHYDDYKKRVVNNKHIHLLGPKTNIGDYMSFAHFFVLSSDKEGLPLSMLEAMSMGVIPVSTPAGGIKDVIRNNVNGFMGQEVSDECFYKTVKRAIGHGKDISKDAIVKEYQEKYSMEICADNYMKCYKHNTLKNA